MSTSNISVVELEAQLRQAEARRAEVERQYAEALSNLRSSIPTDPLEARQSKVRELEKKVALETVRVEELQLELASQRRTTSSSALSSAAVGVSTLSSITSVPSSVITSTSWTGGNHQSHHHQPTSSTNVTSTVTSTPQQGTEIERIMAKIEQDNRILAELEHSRSTTLSAPECQWGLSSSATGSTNNNQLDPSVYGGTTAVSAPVSPLPSQNPNNLSGSVHTNYQYAPNNLGTASTSANMSGLYSQQQFSSTAPGVTGGGVTGAYGAYSSSLPPGVSSAAGIYTNHHHATNVSGITSGFSSGITSTVGASSYVNPLLTNQQPYSNLIAATSALTNQQSTVFTNNTGGISGLAGTALGGVGSSYTSTALGNHSTFSNPLTSTLGGYSTLGNTSSLFNNNASSFTNNPLISSTNQWSSPAMTVKLKPLEEVELGRRIPTPVTPHAPNIWDRPLSRPTITGGGLSDSGGGGDWGMGITDGQVDMLDIPGKGRCSVYIARFSYEPDLETSEDELPVSAGDYLLVWSEPGAPYLDAELLDGRRGLVPAHFAQRLVGDDLLDFHQAVLSSLRDEESAEMLAADVQRLCELTDTNEDPEDETIDTQVGAPRQLTLERQLNKSVLISWTAPEPGQPGSQVESYHVYVDGVLKTTVKASERTRALVEGVDSNRPHRISVRSVTANRRTSRDAACTMVIGRDTQQLGPTAVRATHVTSSSAIISWLPANSNHQHVVCVNNVEVRTVKPGVYRHTITGLTPNTQYRVTVRAKHIRAQPAVPGEEPPCPASAHTDFRTLPKGLPDPPADIMVEAGPQDGTLLVTWHPVQAPHHPGSIVTGYAVYADGKKVTDVDSPTGDHALIDISKLLGLNPRHVTVRTKARDSQSADSVPTAIPPQVLRGGLRQQRQPHSGVPPHMRPQQRGQPGGPQQQVIIEHEDNLSDKEIFPSGQMHHRTQGPGIPQIEGQLTEEDYMHGRGGRGMTHHQGQQPQHGGNMHQYQQQQQQPQQQGGQQGRNMQQQQRGAGQTMHGAQGQAQAQYYQQQQPTQQQNLQQNQRGAGAQNRRGPQQQGTSNQQGQAPNAPKKARWFVAMYDYDPTTMSPNPDACEEELPFSEGDSIKVWGDKDPDGFYWGECRGRRGYVPHNMVMEVEGPPRSNDRDRWGDIYANMPVKRMVALYDYDPQELSPNVDSEVELSFTTGSIIHVYGEMDDDGFYMGELDGVRGLVPSNFLTEAPDQFQGPGSVGSGMMQQQTSGGAGGSMGPRSQRNMMGAGGGGGAVSGGSGGSGGGSGVGGRGHGPGARGPPPPPRGVGDGPVGMSPSSAAGGMPPGATPGSRSGAPRGTKTDACPVVPCSQLDTTTNTVTTVSPPNTLLSSSTEQQRQAAMQNQQRGGVQRGGTIGGSQQQQTPQQQYQQSQQQQQQQQQQSNTFQNQNNQFNNQNQYQQNQQYMGQQQMGNDPMMNRSQQPMHKGTPSVLPNISLGGPQQGPPGQQGQPQNATNAPNALMQKFTEMAAPGGDILSKGKELIFMKFGLGGK